MLDYLRYYDLETYLFEDVGRHFRDEGRLTAFDFFSIVVWKSRRATSKMASRILRMSGEETLEAGVAKLAADLKAAGTPRDRLRVMIEDWGFLLPMASAVLTVLWPDEFSVYDTRVCGELESFQKLGSATRFDVIWSGYQEYLAAVRDAVQQSLSLRDKDRFLWGRSSASQLQAAIGRRFARADAEPAAGKARTRRRKEA